MKLAVVLFNLGGPDGPAAVKPFLYNLFKDPAIIGAPALVRYPLARFISTTREKTAQANYAIMGGASPLLPETQAQARELEAALKRLAPGDEAKVFIAMRYWKPFAAETAKAVAAFAPDQIVLLPLYPQYSTTTSASSLKDWKRAYKGPGRSREICCYPTAGGLIEAHAEAIRDKWITAGKPSNIRLLFSAHGLPQKVVDAGDPYRAQIQATAAAIAAQLPELPDWEVCFQSRVGPLKWLEPSTDAEIRRAGAEGKGVIVAPVAFVSEHVETLVELDHEYARLAAEVGCSPYLRSPTPGVRQAFVDGLAEAVILSLGRLDGARPYGPWQCGAGLARCACRPESSYEEGLEQGHDVSGGG
ncbi:ferrochelatase [Phenylobacterium soli]|uniref:Ferrochelatase n=1 Tax=Phenylobacterium soli TaxID=2170551 RepID=A0A328AG33_9CAUL|nr:ferrochelatase [Phenylobacterium soli]RAK53609.1 ferrochelatase [Phenylobacterium soli]